MTSHSPAAWILACAIGVCTFPLARAQASPSPAAVTPTAQATAAPATCVQQAAEKKLAGAAKNSFMTRCEREATERCEAAATEKKLAGAARTASLNKCLRESIGEK